MKNDNPDYFPVIVTQAFINSNQSDAIDKLYGEIAAYSGTKTPEETELFYNALDILTQMARSAENQQEALLLKALELACSDAAIDYEVGQSPCVNPDYWLEQAQKELDKEEK